MNQVKKMVKNLLNQLIKIIKPYYSKMKKFYYRERTINKINGPKTSKRIYIIRRPPKDFGFFSNFFYVLGHLVYADKNGYAPVIDMENYPTLYNENKLCKNTKNSWEYYFYQPSEFDLETAYKSNKTILSGDKYFSEYLPIYTDNHKRFMSEEMVKDLHIYIDKYVKVKEDIETEVSDFFKEKGLKDSIVLGVHYRGTDMNVYPGHPKPVTKEEFIKKINSYVKENNVQKVVLCTDEQEMIDLACKEVLCDVVFTNSFRAKEGTKGIHQTADSREGHKYLMGKEVLVDALVLSRCDYLLCGHSNVPYAAMLFNNNEYKAWEYVV